MDTVPAVTLKVAVVEPCATITLAGIVSPAGELDKLTSTVQASGTKASPHGHGSLTLTKATAYGRAIDSLSGDATLDNGTLHIAKVTLKAPGGTVLGAGSYNLSTHQMVADLHSDDVQLSHVPELQLVQDEHHRRR